MKSDAKKLKQKKNNPVYERVGKTTSLSHSYFHVSSNQKQILCGL